MLTGSRKTYLIILLATVALFTFATALAEEAAHPMEEIVVSASRVEENINDTSATVNSLTQEELDEIKYRNPQEFLARIPGIFSHNFGNESELTSIRVPTHFTNPYTLILLDGVPVAGYGSGSSGQFAEVNSNSIERIEVVKGPASALYGSNAIGGVINMITKDPATQPTARIDFEYGDYDQIRSAASIASSGEKFGFMLDMNYKDNKSWREHSNFEKKGGNLKVNFTPSEKSIFTFKMDYLDKTGQTAGSLEEEDFNEDWQQSYNTFTHSDLTRFAPSLKYSQDLGAGKFSTTVAYRDIEGESIPDYSIRSQGPAHVGSQNKNKESAGNIQLLYHQNINFVNSRIIVGVDGESGTNKADAYSLLVDWDSAENKYTGYTNTGMNKSFDIQTQVIAPYMQWELRPNERFKVNLGGRYDQTSYDVKDKLTDTDEDSEFSRVTPKAGVIYDFSPKVNSFLSYSQGFVVPTSSQLLTSSWSNKDLDPEKADNYELGVRSKFMDNRLRFDLAVFYMTIQDKIITQDVGMYSRQYVNAGETSQKGAELTGVYQANRWLSFAGAYTYANNRYEEYSTGSEDYSGNTPPRSPDHRLNLRVATTPVQRMRVELEMDMVSSEYSDDANLYEYSRPTLLNLRASYDWSNWSAWGHLLNLTDQKYASYSSYSSSDGVKYYSGAPLTFFVGLSYAWSK